MWVYQQEPQLQATTLGVSHHRGQVNRDGHPVNICRSLYKRQLLRKMIGALKLAAISVGLSLCSYCAFYFGQKYFENPTWVDMAISAAMFQVIARLAARETHQE